MRQLFIGIAIGAAVALIVLGGFPSGSLTPPAPDPSLTNEESSLNTGSNVLSIGKPAPHFALQNVQHQSYALQDFEGKVVLLNFWATWCAPCRLEMPLLEQHHLEFSDTGLVILGINLQESAEDVQAFVDEMSLTFPILLDTDGQVSKRYRIIGYPSSIVIDREGIVQTIHIGIISESQLHEYLHQAGFTL